MAAASAKGMTVATIFTAVDKFSAIMAKMKSSVSGFADHAAASLSRVDRIFKRLTPNLGGFGKKLFSFVGQASLIAGVLATATFGGKSIIEYETSLHSLQAVTGASYKLFQNQIEGIAKKTKSSALDVTSSFEVIGSAMSQYLQDPKSLGLITQAGITLSRASRQELTPTLDNLTNIMNQFTLGADKAEYAINRLTAGEIVGSMRTSEVAKALQEFGAGAKLANIDLGESVTLVEVLGRQMDHSMVGNAAKNITLILNSAKGLAKRAQREFRKNKVDPGVLMDTKLSLFDRLKELSKILKDPVAMVKVFGRENLTAGQIILSNLGLYKDWANQVASTNKANEQAATNMDTVSSKWDQLKASFVNALVSGGKFDGQLDSIKNTLSYVADNMESILKWVFRLISAFAILRTGIFLVRTALLAYNVIQGLAAATTTATTAAVVAERVAVSGFGAMLPGVAAQFATAETAATGFFATLSSFAVPAALVTLSGLAIWKMMDEYDKMQKQEATLLKKTFFNRGSAIGLMSPFSNQKEETGYQAWWLKNAQAGASRDTLNRDRFDKQFGKNFPDLFDPSRMQPQGSPKPVFVPRPTDRVINPSDTTIHIILNDPNGNVSDVKQVSNSGNAKINVTVTPTTGKK